MKNKSLRIKNNNGLIRNIRSNCRIFSIGLLALFMIISVLSIAFFVTPAEAVDPPSIPHIWMDNGNIHGTGFLGNHSLDLDILLHDGLGLFGSIITDNDGNFVYNCGQNEIGDGCSAEASDGTNNAGTSYTGDYYSFRYQVESYSDPTYSVPKDDFVPGNIVFAKGVKNRGINHYLKLEFYDSNNNLRNAWTTNTPTNTITCSHLIPSDAPLGQWTIKFYSKISNYTSFRLRTTDHFNVAASGTEVPNNEGNIIINLYYITNGNLTATFGGAAGGNINYWIEDLNVKAEFAALWNVINGLKGNLNSVSNTASYAFFQGLANNEQLKKQNYTLMVYRDAINNSFKRIYILRNEIVAFEKNYLNFVNGTNATLTQHGENIGLNEAEISNLQSQVNDLSGIIAFLRNILIALGVVAILAIALFFINRRYPLAQMRRNGNGLVRRAKQNKIMDYVEKVETPVETTAKKTSWLKDKVMYIRRLRIKRNPKKSPLRFLPRIRRNPERSPLRLLFSFFTIHK